MPAAPLILAVDTSCDDTSAAVTQGTTVLSNVVASQTQLHKQYGGVFPTVAKQAHRENITPTITAALKRAGVSWKNIDIFAVTQGPGLAPALEVGITAIKELAATHAKPIVAVNHVEGHVLSVLAQPQARTAATPTLQLQFPALALVISGGHSEFILVSKIGEYQRLGWTVDDAAGEVLDKVGRMLDLGYPAGPVVEEFAKLGNPKAFAFPLPMTTSGDFNLSFSGLKTSARNLLEKLTTENDLNKTQIYDFCASFQYAVFRSICYKLGKILQNHEIKELWLGGGVAANITLRRMIRETAKTYAGPEKNLPLRVPYIKKLCSDNAAMIGVVAGFKAPIITTEPLERRPRWEI
ncbi:MAG: tRNA (adenosine(37)-N6)-threonylcarbamoyltransferase complex transferase subunit TsaD [bacterium]|nr:tRNA (adenosine(37)-N6)-threonylcarbamoyltransferase complex transferase subunit TsaD [bacterium]